MSKIILILPTLNEVNNIKKLYSILNKINIKFKYLFVDHGSIDGTRDIINKIKKKKSQKCLHNTKKNP